jgi:predicted small lipoprotein YifL
MLGLMAGVLVGIAGCGQRGPLYLPDKNARVVTHPAASAPDTSAPSSAPGDSSAAASAPAVAPH